MFQLALSLPGTTEISYGSSKLFQILMPLATYMLLQELPGLKQLIYRLIKVFRPQNDPRDYEYLVNMLLGFFSWKVGCDLGFLIVNTAAAPWSIAFTVAGLIPYTLCQYFLYYLIGHKMILQGQPNPFKEDFVVKKLKERPPLWKQFLSKFFHENMNVTSANVPLRQVLLKPLVDYGGLITSWPLYNVGLLFFQSGEINFAPMVHFMFLNIFVFYVVNVMGYILGYNLGEFLYFRVIYLAEWLKKQTRRLTFVTTESASNIPSSSTSNPAAKVTANGTANGTSNPPESPLFQNPLLLKFKTLRLTLMPPVQEFLDRYGLNIRWLLSASMGVIFVVLLEPNLAGAIFSGAGQVQHFLFYTFGQMDQTHVQQFLSASSSAPSPDPTLLTQQFPEQLDFYAATHLEGTTIALNRF